MGRRVVPPPNYMHLPGAGAEQAAFEVKAVCGFYQVRR